MIRYVNASKGSSYYIGGDLYPILPNKARIVVERKGFQ